MIPSSSEELKAAVRGRIAEVRARRDAFVGLPVDATPEDALSAWDELRRPLVEASSWSQLLSAVHPDAAMRGAAEEMEQELSVVDTELSLDREAFERLAAIDPASVGEGETGRLLEHSLRDFRRSGVDRDGATRERVAALQEELVTIGQEFDRNIVQARCTLRIAEGHAGLAGLSDDFVASHPEAADGSVTITGDPPDFVPFMSFAERGDLRERLFRLYQQRAWPENGDVLAKLIARRHELASLLGYGTWAEYITEDKMVRTPERALEFALGISRRARPRADAEYAELLEEKRRTVPDAVDVRDWERPYLIERVKKGRFGFDSQVLREYFPIRAVTAGIHSLVEDLFGLEIVRDEGVAVWHPSVEVYEVRRGGAAIARFFLDLHSRDGKFKHAAMFHLDPGSPGGARREDAPFELPSAALVCNLPEATNEDPGLLLHSQVTTLFHEYGHLMHHLLSGGRRYLRFSGIATEWDFVEVPSQLFEEWAWDPATLARFARHWKTGEPIPAELVAGLRAAEEYGKGLQVARQMSFALLSLRTFHEGPAPDPGALYREIRAEHVPFPAEPDGHFEVAFGHLNDYSALYYTYMWSLVIAKDCFTPFAEDPLAKEPAERYLRAILSAGGTRDADDLVRDFLGREYGPEAFEAWLARG